MVLRASGSEAREAAAAPWPACGVQSRAAPASRTILRAPGRTGATDEGRGGKPLRPARRDARGRDQRRGTRLVGRSLVDVGVRRPHERLPGHAAALQPGTAVGAIRDHPGRRACTAPRDLTVAPRDLT